MKFSSLTIFFIIFFVIFSISSLSPNVGVSPGRIDLGKVEKNSTKLVSFYIITSSEETLLVKIEPQKVNLDAIENRIISNLSEEDITSWVKVINNPVELKPTNYSIKTAGGLISGQREINFLIEIPKNAEPGYHTVNVNPIPLESPGTLGPVGGIVVAITPIRVLLDIDGDVVRNGVILDVETGNYVGDRLEINTYFQNTGTVTISADGIQKIYDKDGNFIKELYLGKKYVKPKEIKVFRGLLPTKELSLEDYNVYTVIDYTTGKEEKDSVITIIAPPTALATKYEEGIVIPLLIIIIVIIFVISIIVYRRIK